MPLFKISRKLIFVAQGGFGTFGTKPVPARPPGDVDEEKPSDDSELNQVMGFSGFKSSGNKGNNSTAPQQPSKRPTAKTFDLEDMMARY